MTQTKFVFSYTEISDSEELLEVTMEVPERSIDEMCEHFQRFLTAAGYVFEEGERIETVKDKSDYPGCRDDILSFGTDDRPRVYSFNTHETEPVDFGGQDHIAFAHSGVRGGMSEDIINFKLM